MKRYILFFIMNLLMVHVGFTQQILTSRIVDFSVSNRDFVPYDQGNQIIVVDSNTFICGIGAGKFSYFINATAYYKPAFIITDSLFNSRDSVYFSDTVSKTIITYDRKHKNVWMVSYLSNQNKRFRFRRVNLQGQVLYQDLFPNNDSDFRIISNVFSAYPDEEGGLFLLGTKLLTINGTQTVATSLCRFDSTGILLWQRDYDVVQGGPADYMEKLPNGNLFIFGKYDIFNLGYLVVNPETGDLISNRLLYTYRIGASPLGFSNYVSRTANGGYFVSGSGLNVLSSLRDSASFMASLDSNANIIWRKTRRRGTFKSFSCTDTTVWVISYDSVQSVSLEHYRLDSFRLLHKLIIRRSAFSSSSDIPILSDIATFRNGTALLIGTLDEFAYTGGALFFNKITNVGLAYNPFYQPYPPVEPIDTLATQALSNEPALQLYPNPGNSTLHISHTGELHLYNMQGQLIVSKSVQAGDVINTASLPPGCYLARFRTRTSWLQAKWVKE